MIQRNVFKQLVLLDQQSKIQKDYFNDIKYKQKIVIFKELNTGETLLFLLDE